MKLTPEEIRDLARLTVESKPEELTCEDWVHMVGEYVEATRAGAELTERAERVKRHAESCGACKQELDALSDLLDRDA